MLTDLKMPDMDGLALLREVKKLRPGIEVVVMTGYGSIKSAVEAMKHGAADYITKPFDTDELLMTVDKLIRLKGLRSEVSRLRSELRERYRFENIVGGSPAMRAVYEKIEAASHIHSTVLICGESGTGKELVARAIHYNGPRASQPFVPVNCAAIPGELIESELFGLAASSREAREAREVALLQASRVTCFTRGVPHVRSAGFTSHLPS
ncbi:MAG: sigma-54-dependent Fis family transcriptional regulator [Planctomycetes bacterium]|nr:sigma-54-dependent Fis family transcriptional regulator [Planctomycetota bacterium]